MCANDIVNRNAKREKVKILMSLTLLYMELLKKPSSSPLL